MSDTDMTPNDWAKEEGFTDLKSAEAADWILPPEPRFGVTEQTALLIDFGLFTVRLSDVNRELAMRAHSGTSMVPDKRAFQVQCEYVTEMHQRFSELRPLAVTDDQRAALGNALRDYQSGYITKLAALLSAQSRCLSSMIAGPSNFPVRRMEKANRSADKRRDEFLEWCKLGRRRLKEAVLGERTPEQAADAEWEVLKKAVAHDMVTVNAIETGQLPGFDRSAFTRSVQGKLERIAANGNAALVNRALDYIADRQTVLKRPFFAKNNSVWQLGVRAVKATAAAAQKPTGDVVVKEYKGVRIVNEYGDERVRIYFDSRPGEVVRLAMKQQGWRWSPNAGAWQRLNTKQAEYSAVAICDEFFAKGATDDGNTN